VPVARVGRISLRGALKLGGWTVFGTLGVMAICLAFNWVTTRHLGEAALRQSMVSAVVLPILLAGPLFCYLTLKLRELAIANHKLHDIASTDTLTACLNRGAFSTIVDGWLQAEKRDGGKTGALLMIDADHFKDINDRHGHDQGDEALKIISNAIRSSLRGGDFVGRMGGEEFGVFLPGASEDSATAIAERIRTAICRKEFRPKGKSCPLSVSVGCASFERLVGFSELFRIADERLYMAKRAGRNRVVAAHLAESDTEQKIRALH
jgi:diguanylate cyclase